MTQTRNQKTTVSALIGTPVRDAKGLMLGRVREFAVLAGTDSSRVLGLVLKPSGGSRSTQDNMAAIDDLELSADGLRLSPNANLVAQPQDSALVLLERDL